MPVLSPAGRRTRTFTAAAGLAAAGLILAACGGDGGDGGETVTLSVASWANPDSVDEAVMEYWTSEIEERSEGRITFDISYAGALCAADEIPQCVVDGRADVGQTIADYAAQMFPQTTVVSIPFLTQNNQAFTQAIWELSTEHDGAAALWEQNGLKLVGHNPAGRLLLGSNEPVESIDDIAGQRWRMAGPYTQMAVEEAGGSNVALTAPETYEGVERGVADAAGFPMDGLVAFQLKDILSYWTDPGLGQYTSTGLWMNLDTYEGLPDDLKQIVDEVNEEYNQGGVADVFEEVTLEQCDPVLETIEQINEWDESETERWREAIGTQGEEKWIADAESAGLQDAESYLELYKEKMESFEGETPKDPSLVCSDKA
ncbi:TRAP transporter substrate-binding protein DctP [Microbacterium sp. G2-8]|uniref:TRAP transporter substrate-binding protein DctP n=1 Tax=Microbacterium sp. G2-8 TaxID=2842454 RepID=UPI001C89E7B1|nr:TRAP transporter substrate-binding protein DctP [Microbacterium sp. G2-8]